MQQQTARDFQIRKAQAAADTAFKAMLKASSLDAVKAYSQAQRRLALLQDLQARRAAA